MKCIITHTTSTDRTESETYAVKVMTPQMLTIPGNHPPHPPFSAPLPLAHRCAMLDPVAVSGPPFPLILLHFLSICNLREDTKAKSRVSKYT